MNRRSFFKTIVTVMAGVVGYEVVGKDNKYVWRTTTVVDGDAVVQYRSKRDSDDNIIIDWIRRVQSIPRLRDQYKKNATGSVIAMNRKELLSYDERIAAKKKVARVLAEIKFDINEHIKCFSQQFRNKYSKKYFKDLEARVKKIDSAIDEIVYM